MFVKILNETLKAIADAVRSKTGKTGKIEPSEILDKIKGIEGGGGGDFNLVTLAGATYNWGVWLWERRGCYIYQGSSRVR